MKFSSSVRVVVLCVVVAVLVGCGGSGGGSGDKLQLSNARGSISADFSLINLCAGLGFPSAYVFTADYDGDLNVGDQYFTTVTFLPSGGTLNTSGLIGANIASSITPNDVSAFDCYIAQSDTTLRVEMDVINSAGVRSNTVSATFNI